MGRHGVVEHAKVKGSGGRGKVRRVPIPGSRVTPALT